jgi:serine/threonine-protein kinase
MLSCPHCKAQNQESARFCAACGQPLARTGTGVGLLLPKAVIRGRYVIGRQLGKGGMAAVYQATDLAVPGAVWAIKELSALTLSPGDQQQAVAAFRREVQFLSALKHPCLPKVVTNFEDAGKHYLVMEYVDGRSLEEMLEGMTAPFPESQVLFWARQLCSVLDCLHTQNPPIIFRDLKPGNIMIDRAGQVKLIDFGIARHFRPGKASDTEPMGTPGYAAPEAYGRGQTDARSDIYSLGATLHTLLTRYDPAQTPLKLPPVHSLNPQVSAQTARVVEKATQNRPDDRYPSVAEMSRALFHVRKPIPWRQIALAAGGVVLVALLAWVLAAFVLGGGDGTPTPTPLAVVTERTSGTATALAPTPLPPTPTPAAGGSVPVQPSSTRMVASATPPRTPTVAPSPAAVTVQPTAALPGAAPPGLLAYSVYSLPHNAYSYSIWVVRADGSGARKLIGLASEPAFSADGRQIAYYHWLDGVWVARADGSNARRVVNNSRANFASWSPDGSQLAYQLETGAARQFDLHVVLADGTNDRLLVAGLWPSWSPDGRLIAYESCIGGTCGIFVIRPDGGGKRQLTRDVGHAPAWAPGGTQIAYCSEADRDFEIYVMDADGTDVRQLTDNRSADALPVWSPDGQYLFFRTDRTGTWSIFRMRADGSDPQRVVDAPVNPDRWDLERLSMANQ